MPDMQEHEPFRRLNPRLDANFKAIFTQDRPESRLALRSFLTAMIGEEVTEASVKENEVAGQYGGQRGIRYAINCAFADGSMAQVEIQGRDRDYDYGRRAEYYAARLVSSLAEVGPSCEKPFPQGWPESLTELALV